ncbi:hypothetical protein K491DRAFT_679989 [Lophiostoma macrostomum CBS 122681]|uniref:Uncharacterized protein n=1 Tax=Lophiostoma macrostomum CBS 122681 TaxID=1314788 RepID=A0A6A6T5G1_9PLEO|nr:hypothetical protein K491DRAFT_679989 [Lophiostoma macrostomum CBS 122681]
MPISKTFQKLFRGSDKLTGEPARPRTPPLAERKRMNTLPASFLEILEPEKPKSQSDRQTSVSNERLHLCLRRRAKALKCNVRRAISSIFQSANKASVNGHHKSETERSTRSRPRPPIRVTQSFLAEHPEVVTRLNQAKSTASIRRILNEARDENSQLKEADPSRKRVSSAILGLYGLGPEYFKGATNKYHSADHELLPPRKLDNVSNVRPTFSALPKINGRKQYPPWNPRRAHDDDAQSPLSLDNQGIQRSPAVSISEPFPDLDGPSLEPSAGLSSELNPDYTSAPLSTLAVVGKAAPVERHGERRDSVADCQTATEAPRNNSRNSKLDVVVDDDDSSYFLVSYETARKTDGSDGDQNDGIERPESDVFPNMNDYLEPTRPERPDQTDESGQASTYTARGFTNGPLASTSSPGTESPILKQGFEDGFIQLLYEVGKPAKAFCDSTQPSNSSANPLSEKRSPSSSTVKRPVRSSPPNFSRPFSDRNPPPAIPEKSAKRESFKFPMPPTQISHSYGNPASQHPEERDPYGAQPAPVLQVPDELSHSTISTTTRTTAF